MRVRSRQWSLVLAAVPVASALCASVALAQEPPSVVTLPPLNGFQPLVIFGLSDEQQGGGIGDLNGVFSHTGTSPGTNGVPSNTLPIGQPQKYFVGILDTGAQANILSYDTAMQADLGSANRLGGYSMSIVGASGSETAEITDPIGIYMTDLSRGVAAGGGGLTVSPGTAFRGMWNTSVLTAEENSVLPNIIGAPAIGLYQAHIKNSQPTHVTVGSTTYKSPKVGFEPINTAIPSSYGRIGLQVTNTIGGPPLFFPTNYDNVADNPQTPSIWESLFANITVTHTAGSSANSFFFDTGAQVSVLSKDTAGAVGIYTDGDEKTQPDFTTEILGVGGEISEVPGYYIDGMSMSATSGALNFNQVPVIVLDLPDPRNPNQVLPGIIGMNLFTAHDIIINVDTEFTAKTGVYVSPRWMWKFNGSGNWSDATRWNLVLPNGVDTQANFFSAITAPQTVTVDGNFTVGTLAFDNANRYTLAGGAGGVILDVSTGNAQVNVTRGSHTVNVPLTFADPTELNVLPAGSVLTVNGQISAGNVPILKNGQGTAELRNVRAQALEVNRGTVRILPNGTSTGVSRIEALTIAQEDARLDLTNNHLVITGDAAALGTFSASAYTGITGLIDAGRGSAGNAQWDGTGIVTSDSRAVNSGNRAGLGVATGAQALGLTGTATATWNGQTVSADDVLVMFTYAGDATLDGRINIDDYGRIDSNVAQSGSVFGWYNGDFNYDGSINIDDYGIIDANVSAQGAPLSASASADASAVAAVPEPAGLLISLTGLLALRRRQR